MAILFFVEADVPCSPNNRDIASSINNIILVAIAMHGVLAVSKYFLTKRKKEDDITEPRVFEKKNCYLGIFIYLIAMALAIILFVTII